MDRFKNWLFVSEAVTTPPHMFRNWLEEMLAKCEHLEEKAQGVLSLSKKVAHWVEQVLYDRHMERAITSFLPYLPSRFGSSLDGVNKYDDPLSYEIKTFLHAVDKNWIQHNDEAIKYLKQMIKLPAARSEYKEGLEHYFYFLKNFKDLKQEVQENKDSFGPDNETIALVDAVQQLDSLKEKFDAVYSLIQWYFKFAPRIQATIEQSEIAIRKSWGEKTGILPAHKPQEILYHATIDIPALLQQGFKTRNELGTSALGGGPSDVISFTADLDIAKAIVDGIYEIIDIAKGKMSFQDVEDRTSKEYSPEYIQKLNQRGAWAGHPLDSARREYQDAKKKNFPDPEGERYHILSAYKSFMISHPKRYDPLFWGVKLNDFMNFDPQKVGIVACRVDMSQVKEYLASMAEFRLPSSAILSVKQVPYQSPYFT